MPFGIHYITMAIVIELGRLQYHTHISRRLPRPPQCQIRNDNHICCAHKKATRQRICVASSRRLTVNWSNSSDRDATRRGGLVLWGQVKHVLMRHFLGDGDGSDDAGHVIYGMRCLLRRHQCLCNQHQTKCAGEFYPRKIAIAPNALDCVPAPVAKKLLTL